MTTRRTDNRGFTLAEVLIASTISSFIALAAVGALKAVTDSTQLVDRATETAGEVRFAARMIQADLANLYRDPDPKAMKLVGASQESDALGPAILTFYASGCAKARVGQPEGDIYEVEYFLGKNPNAEAQPEGEEEEMQEFVLFRRLWPNPDKERNPGGVLSPIAENIIAFAMQFSDGQQLVAQWPEELQSIPEMVEVTLVAQPKDRGRPVIERFRVNFPRLAARGAGIAGEGSQGEQGGGQPPQGQPQQEGSQGTPGTPEQR